MKAPGHDPAIEALASKMRAVLKGTGALGETRMFGGIAFMLNGNLMAAASRNGLLLRVGAARHATALARHGTRPMVMRGRELQGYLYVEPRGLTAPALAGWLDMAREYVQTLEPKSRAARPRAKKKKPKARA